MNRRIMFVFKLIVIKELFIVISINFLYFMINLDA